MRVGVAGDFPAFEVLGADCETEVFGGRGEAEGEVGGHLVGVVEFVGDLNLIFCILGLRLGLCCWCCGRECG